LKGKKKARGKTKKILEKKKKKEGNGQGLQKHF
jgi:hypothetical protein